MKKKLSGLVLATFILQATANAAGLPSHVQSMKDFDAILRQHEPELHEKLSKAGEINKAWKDFNDLRNRSKKKTKERQILTQLIKNLKDASAAPEPVVAQPQAEEESSNQLELALAQPAEESTANAQDKASGYTPDELAKTLSAAEASAKKSVIKVSRPTTPKAIAREMKRNFGDKYNSRLNTDAQRRAALGEFNALMTEHGDVSLALVALAEKWEAEAAASKTAKTAAIPDPVAAADKALAAPPVTDSGAKPAEAAPVDAAKPVEAAPVAPVTAPVAKAAETAPIAKPAEAAKVEESKTLRELEAHVDAYVSSLKLTEFNSIKVINEALDKLDGLDTSLSGTARLALSRFVAKMAADFQALAASKPASSDVKSLMDRLVKRHESLKDFNASQLKDLELILASLKGMALDSAKTSSEWLEAALAGRSDKRVIGAGDRAVAEKLMSFLAKNPTVDQLKAIADSHIQTEKKILGMTFSITDIKRALEVAFQNKVSVVSASEVFEGSGMTETQFVRSLLEMLSKPADQIRGAKASEVKKLRSIWIELAAKRMETIADAGLLGDIKVTDDLVSALNKHTRSHEFKMVDGKLQMNKLSMWQRIARWFKEVGTKIMDIALFRREKDESSSSPKTTVAQNVEQAATKSETPVQKVAPEVKTPVAETKPEVKKAAEATVSGNAPEAKKEKDAADPSSKAKKVIEAIDVKKVVDDMTNELKLITRETSFQSLIERFEGTYTQHTLDTLKNEKVAKALRKRNGKLLDHLLDRASSLAKKSEKSGKGAFMRILSTISKIEAFEPSTRNMEQIDAAVDEIVKLAPSPKDINVLAGFRILEKSPSTTVRAVQLAARDSEDLSRRVADLLTTDELSISLGNLLPKDRELVQARQALGFILKGLIDKHNGKLDANTVEKVHAALEDTGFDVGASGQNIIIKDLSRLAKFSNGLNEAISRVTGWFDWSRGDN